MRRTEELDRRYRRHVRRGLLLSLLLHLLIFLFFARGAEPPAGSAAGPRAGDDRAAAAGGMQAVTMRVEPEIVLRPPDPVAAPDVVIEFEDLPEFEPTGAGQDGLAGLDIGPLEGPGLPGGDGRGDGGTDMEGLFRLQPPQPRSLFMPPANRPGSVRGREVRVAVFVDERGRVVGDSTRLRPPTGDAGFDARLRSQAAQWLFEPAKRAGQPVAQWFEYILTL